MKANIPMRFRWMIQDFLYWWKHTFYKGAFGHGHHRMRFIRWVHGNASPAVEMPKSAIILRWILMPIRSLRWYWSQYPLPYLKITDYGDIVYNDVHIPVSLISMFSRSSDGTQITWTVKNGQIYEVSWKIPDPPKPLTENEP